MPVSALAGGGPAARGVALLAAPSSVALTARDMKTRGDA
jgi:hypothetical protein